MRILVDMDGTIADWGERFDRVVAQLAREGHGIPYSSEQRSFDLKEGLDAEDQAVIDLVMDYPGYYADINPIPGALMALQRMMAAGHDVAIVTSPWITNPTCVVDKVKWVETHLGSAWLNHLIIAKDKTRIAGDVLVDDKPEITGALAPEWEHVYFDQPYNRENSARRRLTDWSQWPTLVGRKYTQPTKTESGSTRLPVHRMCNGCGRDIGDVNEAELEAAVAGRPLPDVRGECGCAA